MNLQLLQTILIKNTITLFTFLKTATTVLTEPIFVPIARLLNTLLPIITMISIAILGKPLLSGPNSNTTLSNNEKYITKGLLAGAIVYLYSLYTITYNIAKNYKLSKLLLLPTLASIPVIINAIHPLNGYFGKIMSEYSDSNSILTKIVHFDVTVKQISEKFSEEEEVVKKLVNEKVQIGKEFLASQQVNYYKNLALES